MVSTNKPHLGKNPRLPKTIQQSILDHVGNGGSITDWCANNGRTISTVYKWLYANPEFALAYNQAREMASEAIADRMRQLAATPSDHPDDVAHRKLQLDTDRWLIARWNPSRYGDRQHVEHGGGVQLMVSTGVPRPDKESTDESSQGRIDG